MAKGGPSGSGKGGTMGALRAALYLGISGLGLFTADIVRAQDQNAPPAPPEQVVVTGSLLGAANFTAPTPVTQVTAVDIQTRALTGIGSLVSQLPYSAPGGGLVQNTFGIVQAGQSLINLRDLGTNRTLTLIDGQRPNPVDAANEFDTNMIPSILVDHFDVVTTGASASYGSDAVAGVVNFVLKDRLEGFISNLQFGTSQYWDTKQLLAGAAYGTNFANGRGHFVIGGEYAKEYDTVGPYARPWGRLEENLVALPPTRAAGLPANLWSQHAEVDNGTPGGLIASCSITPCPIQGTSFGPGGTPYAFPYGAITGASYTISTGNYGNSGLNRALNPPYMRLAGLAHADYDITPDINAFVTVNYGQLEDYGPNQGTPFPIPVIIASGNPYLPPSIQAAMTADKISTITVNKETLDIPGAHADNKNTMLQSFFGLKGALGDWSWDLEGEAGRAEIWQTFANVPVTANLDASSYVVQGPNGPVCGPTATNPNFNAITNAAQKAALIANIYPGCVPLNIFGPDTASAAALNYVLNPPDGGAGSRANARQYMVQADLRGPAINLPAGPLDTAVGANWRYNSFDQQGSVAALKNVFAARNNPSYYASQSVYEFYGEVGVPLVADLPFAKAIDLNGAARYTNYSISGPVTTWKYGATWDVNDFVRLRGTVSTDIRAPNFLETTNVPASSSAQQIQNPITGVRQFLSGIVTDGNPALKPEIGHDMSAGIVLTPDFSWFPGLRASVDYFRVNLTGVITSVTAQDVVNRCLGQPGPPPVPPIPSYCSQITFNSTPFGISNITLEDLNLNRQLVDGYDINITDNLPIDRLGLPGALRVVALGSYQNDNRIIQTLTNGTIQSINYADTGPAPRWSSNVNLAYSIDRFTTSLQYRYYSPIRYSVTLVGPDDPNYSPALSNSISRNVFPQAQIWDLQFSYELLQRPDGEDLQVYLNIDDVLNTDPPAVWWYVQNYDVVGRYFKVGLRYTLP